MAAILYVLATPAVVRYGDRLRDFGWLAARSGGVLVVGRVDPAGPAGGLLQEGDVVLAWIGDRRVTRVSPAILS